MMRLLILSGVSVAIKNGIKAVAEGQIPPAADWALPARQKYIQMSRKSPSSVAPLPPKPKGGYPSPWDKEEAPKPKPKGLS